MGVSSQGKSQIWSGKQRKYNFLRSDSFTHGRTNSDLDRSASFLEDCSHYDMLISNPDPPPFPNRGKRVSSFNTKMSLAYLHNSTLTDWRAHIGQHSGITQHNMAKNQTYWVKFVDSSYHKGKTFRCLNAESTNRHDIWHGSFKKRFW